MVRRVLALVVVAGIVAVAPGYSQTILLEVDGADPSGNFGASVDTAGDVDRDGVLDFVVGAPLEDGMGGANSGVVRIVSGADGSVIFRLDGEAAGDFLGRSVSRAGDVDRDGYPDVIAGAYGHDGAGDDAGRAYLLSGKNGSILHVMDGVLAGDLFGYSVANAGDVDGDTHPDVIVGAYLGNYARVHSGVDGSILFDFPGEAVGDGFGCAVAGIGDADGDGIPDLAVGANQSDIGRGYVRVFSGADGTSDHLWNGQSILDWFGWSVAALGDVDGDGLADYAVGAPFRNSVGEDSGRVYVISPATSGLLYTIDGDEPFAWFGRSISRVGDLDGDGRFEFAVGSPYDRFASDAPGRVAVFSGGSGIALFEAVGDEADDWFGESVRGVGDLDADGFADIAVGVPLADTAAGGVNAGSVRVLSSAASWCTPGSVDLTSFSVTPVLFVNEETGGGAREVAVSEGAPIRFSMALPPAGGNGKFVVHANDGRPRGSGLTVLPELIGVLCNPILLDEGAMPIAIWNNFGKEPRIGASTYFDGTPIPDPERAPVDFLDLPDGDVVNLPAGTVVTLQGIVLDPGSVSVRGASATNAVTLVVN